MRHKAFVIPIPPSATPPQTLPSQKQNQDRRWKRNPNRFLRHSSATWFSTGGKRGIKRCNYNPNTQPASPQEPSFREEPKRYALCCQPPPSSQGINLRQSRVRRQPRASSCPFRAFQIDRVALPAGRVAVEPRLLVFVERGSHSAAQGNARKDRAIDAFGFSTSRGVCRRNSSIRETLRETPTCAHVLFGSHRPYMGTFKYVCGTDSTD